MEEMKHLTKKQLLSYSKGWLKDQELREIGNHLLNCDVCLAEIPEPSPEQFLRVLFTENDVNEQMEVESSETEKSFFTGFSILSAFYKHPLLIAWGSGAFIVILSFSILVWITAGNQDHLGREIAFEKKEAGFELNPNNQKSDLIITDEDSDKDHEQLENPQNTPVSNKGIQKSEKQNKRKISQKNKKTSTKRELNQNNVSKFTATRGGAKLRDNCDKTGLGANFRENEGKIVLTWKKFPNATKYHLYISDDEEILIDEYETLNNTSYVVNKSLDPAKTYSWKILVTLENGETVIGTSKKFSLNDFQMNEETLKSKGKSDVRCVEKN